MSKHPFQGGGERGVVGRVSHAIFRWRRSLLALFVVITLVLGYCATQLGVQAGFTKMIPLKHEYMQTFVEYQKDFGGANKVLIALRQKDGDIYNAAFMDTLRRVTDEVFYLKGV
jgi:predicted RND superfamily exporter protein